MLKKTLSTVRHTFFVVFFRIHHNILPTSMCVSMCSRQKSAPTRLSREHFQCFNVPMMRLGVMERRRRQKWHRKASMYTTYLPIHTYIHRHTHQHMYTILPSTYFPHLSFDQYRNILCTTRVDVVVVSLYVKLPGSVMCICARSSLYIITCINVCVRVCTCVYV